MKAKSLNQVSLLLSAGIFFLIHSCTIYIPQPVSMPLMNEKNEVQLSGGFTFLSGVGGSIAYAAGDHVALQAYGCIHPDNINYFQCSVGYYTKSKSDLNFEIYAGFAGGNGSEWGFDEAEMVNGNYLLYFAQANIGQTNLGSAHIDYGFGLKTGFFEAKVKEALFTNITPYTTNGFLIEPQVFMRMGSERLKVGFQVNGAKIYLDKEKKEFSDYYNRLNLCVSINYRFTPSIKRK